MPLDVIVITFISGKLDETRSVLIMAVDVLRSIVLLKAGIHFLAEIYCFDVCFSKRAFETSKINSGQFKFKRVIKSHMWKVVATPI